MSHDFPELRFGLLENSDDLLAYFVRRVSQPADAADLLGELMLQAWKCEMRPSGANRVAHLVVRDRSSCAEQPPPFLG